jgi:hypothetical protein
LLYQLSYELTADSRLAQPEQARTTPAPQILLAPSQIEPYNGHNHALDSSEPSLQ